MSRFAEAPAPAVRTLTQGERSAASNLPRRSLTVAIQITSDLAALLVAALLAGTIAGTGLIRAGWTPLFEYYYLALLVPTAYATAGLYPAVGMSPVDELRRFTIATVAVLIISLAGIAVVGKIVPSWTLVLAGLLTLFTVPVVRAVTRELFARRAWWGVPVVVLGAGRTAQAVIGRLIAHPRVGIKPVACLDDDPQKIGSEIAGVPVTGPLSDVAVYQRRGVRQALVAMPGLEPCALVELLRKQGRGFASLVVVPNLFGVASVGVGTRDLGGVLGLFVKHNLLSTWNRVAKRCLDAALILPAVLLGAPVVALCALAVLIVSPGNPFYAQERVGYRDRAIRIWKLRTMRVDADAVLERTLDADPAARAEWERHFKLSNDPRIIPVIGHVLRRASLDELPQVLNVLRGELSFVGPRPFPRYHLDAFSPEFRELRACVRPGITGLWQVNERSDGDLAAQEEADSFYIRNWSIWMDVYVLARTPLAVLGAKGAR